ncbi:MAG: hypothetical protein FJW37_10190 [Acidobacteria bacterium]|nr:hypothetical protein [Acidobacteriota bacterium]
MADKPRKLTPCKPKDQLEPGANQATGKDDRPKLTLTAPHKAGTPAKIEISGEPRLAFGTNDEAVRTVLFNQLLNLVHTDASKPIDQGVLDRALALMVGIAPRDAVEGMLAVQMVGAHIAAADAARRSMIPGQTAVGYQMYLSLAGKLMRTFTGQLEALNRGRGKGAVQRVVVERVNVEPGAQAVVGAVATPAGGRGST